MVVGERQNSQLEIVINIQNVFSESEGGYLRRQFSPVFISDQIRSVYTEIFL